jgi:uncharacterized protein (TIGR03437 family)
MAASGTYVAIDRSGNVWTTSVGVITLTTPDAYQRAPLIGICGTYQLSPFSTPQPVTCPNTWVQKQDANGNLLYATYLTGSGGDNGTAITTDESGNAYVAGWTYSGNFPVTSGAFQRQNAGPLTAVLKLESITPFGVREVVPGGDVFVAKFSADGKLIYSTLLGGTGNDVPSLIAVDASGYVYVAGTTTSTDFPVTSGASTAQAPKGSFFARLDPTGSMLSYSTRYDPSISGFDIDSQGNAWLTGLMQPSGSSTQGPYVAKLDTNTGRLIYSTFLPNLDPKYNGVAPGFQGSAFAPTAISVAASGTLVLGLNTEHFNGTPPPSLGIGQSYILQFSADGSSILTEVNGQQYYFDSIYPDSAGNLYLFGHGQISFPDSPPLLSESCGTPNNGTFVWEMDASLHTLAQGYLRQGSDTAVSITTPSHFFVYRAINTVAVPVDLTARPAMTFACTHNLASDAVGWGLAEGEIFVIHGSSIGPATGVAGVPDPNNHYPVSLGGVQVLIQGHPIPLIYAQASEIHGVAPFYLFGGSADIVVQYNGQTAPPMDAGQAAYNPAIFTIGNQGAILNQDGTVNTPSTPAKLGSVVSIYATGTGALPVAMPDGQVVPLPPPVFTLAQTPSVTFANTPGKVLWAGAAPALVAELHRSTFSFPASCNWARSLPARCQSLSA